jgi:hypothetical protein
MVTMKVSVTLESLPDLMSLKEALIDSAANLPVSSTTVVLRPSKASWNHSSG